MKTYALKVIPLLAVYLVLVFLLTLPARGYIQRLDDREGKTSDDFFGFSNIETRPGSFSYRWGLADATIGYLYTPRHTPINLRLKLSLARPAGAPPARLEVYESTYLPGKDPRLVGVIEGNNEEAQDYYLTIPARTDGGRGLWLELKSNTFKVAGDARQLGFIFLESEITMPNSQMLQLFWPHPFWPAALLLLGALCCWGLRAKLSLLETGLLVGMSGLVIITIADTAYQSSWWLLLAAAGVWLAFWWEGRNGGMWPTLLAASLLLLFFMFGTIEHYPDIQYYADWAASIRTNGLWNMYNYHFGLGDKVLTLNYPPLILYLLSLLNLVTAPFGLQSTAIAWKVTAAVLFLLTVLFLYLTARAAKGGQSIPLLLIACNAALFYNPVLWGQSDILPVLMLSLSFYLIYTRRPMLAGLALGLTLISKPQALFVLPLLVWLYFRRCGVKKATLGLLLGGVVAVILTAFTFGLDWSAVMRYLQDPQLLGNYANDIPSARNFNYLVLGTQNISPPAWLTLLGLAMLGGTFLVVAYFSRHDQSLERDSIGTGLLAVTAFTWLIKMKDRYLLYALPFFGLAALREKRWVKPFLLLSWLQLAQLVFTLSNYGRKTIGDNFYWWTTVITDKDGWLRLGISLAMLATYFYLAVISLRALVRKP